MEGSRLEKIKQKALADPQAVFWQAESRLWKSGVTMFC